MDLEQYYAYGIGAMIGYASLVVVKWIMYVLDTRKLVAMMEIMNRQPEHVTRNQFLWIFVILTAFGLWFTVWWHVVTEGFSYFRRQTNEDLYEAALKLSR